ncbi:MAG: PKD domain-containing protein [Dysgonamonadaceae bacterium]|nr:PKD domain-containing protein [Dysgonamonadaceae bacterium]
MKQKSISLKQALLLVLFACASVACNDDNGGQEPDISFNSESGEYAVKIGNTVELRAEVKNAVRPFYAWKQDGKVVASDLVYEYKGEVLGAHFVNFRVDADNGTQEKQVIVNVVDKMTPKIKMPANAVAYAGTDTPLACETDYTDATTRFEWTFQGKVVCTDSIYVFNAPDINIYTVAVKVTSADGVDVKNISVSVIPKEQPFIFFDCGRYVLPSQISAVRTQTCPIGRTLVLAPALFGFTKDATFEWEVDGTKQGGTSVCFAYKPASQGIHAVKVTAKEGSNSFTATVNVDCVAPEGTYFRAATLKSDYIARKCFEYAPGPGQHVYGSYQTAQQAIDYAQSGLKTTLGTSYWLSLGPCPGYVIVGFDHSVKNHRADEADLDIVGNAFANWCECGVVWVSQDDNGDGLPNDTWYEIKGSEYGKPSTTQRYAMKYFRPSQEKTDILSISNEGELIFWMRNAYNPNSGYFPWFMTEEYYILTGTCLASGFTNNGLEMNAGYDWGYVDNLNSIPGFRIANAVQQDGTPADLDYIDFVKVQTAQVGQGTKVGDVDTETGAPVDLWLKAGKK